MYYDYAMAAPVMAGVYDNDAEKKEDFSVLVLGNGSGTFATQCRKHFGINKIDAVEIDGSITDLAREYFNLPEEVNVYTYDGRAYLNASEDKYNVIMVDAYQDITVPFQMSSKEFFSLVKDHLKEDGVLVVNMSMRGKGENTINSYLADTISTLFSEVYTIDVTYSSNRELFASNNKDMMDVFRAGYMHLAIMSDTSYHDVFLMSDTVYKGMERYLPGDRVMTDDKAPVELLSMQAIDGIIYDEVAYFKDIYNEKGIKGVIDALQ